MKIYKLKLKCPHCKRNHSFDVCDLIPRQTFDVKCCGGQSVATRIMAIKPEAIIREVVWEKTKITD